MDYSTVYNIKNWKQAKCPSRCFHLEALLPNYVMSCGPEWEDKDGEGTPALDSLGWEMTGLNEASLHTSALGPALSKAVAWAVREGIVCSCALLGLPIQRDLHLSCFPFRLLISEVSKQTVRLKNRFTNVRYYSFPNCIHLSPQS